jgi:transposase InsO family protein
LPPSPTRPQGGGRRRADGRLILVAIIFVATRHPFATRAEAGVKVATWIADFYNTHHRHSAADGLPPIEYEQQIMAARAAAKARAQEVTAA